MADVIEFWLVEDHNADRERLASALKRVEGIRCTGNFGACEDALEALATAPAPQVLLLDLELPGLSGSESIAAIQARGPEVAIVIVTVYDDDEKISRAICAGAIGYLLKSNSIDEIVAGIRTAALGGSPINPRIARRVLEMMPGVTASRRSAYGLTPRERDILELLVHGLTIKETADRLKIGFYTADEYIRSVYRKLHVKSRGGAIAKAVAEKLVRQRGAGD